MAGADQGPEPTGWELLRSIEGLREDVKEIGTRVVSVDVYNADKAGNTERHQRAEARIGSLEQQSLDGEKLRRQQRLTIALAIVAPILSAAFAFLIKVVVP